MQAKQFQSVPSKAVIYVVRNNPDIRGGAAPLAFDGVSSVATYPGTFIRWEAAPGTHRITGMGADPGQITLNTEAGRVYYVRQQVAGWGSPMSTLLAVNEQDGRAVAMRGTLISVQ
jgi:hypothetical protein